MTKEQLAAILPSAKPSLIAEYYQPILDQTAAAVIDTPLRLAHFLAQVGHESGDLRYQQEIADGSAYEGRKDLGNTQCGDGKRFKGRGLIQLTGRANYTAYGKFKGRDFLTHPEVIATDLNLNVDVACWYWTTHGLNTLADGDRAETITRRINGGLNGYPDRLARLAVAKKILGI